MFAQIEQSDLLAMNADLTAKEFQLYAVYRMECFEGEGVCKLNLKQICEKYNFKSYDNLTRINQSLLGKGWLTPTPEGISTERSTEKNSVENELRKTQSEKETTEKNSVEEENQLRKTQLPTEKNAGTEIALNRNLDFKKNLEEKRENAPAPDNFQNYAFLMNLDLPEIHAYFFADKHKLELKDKRIIQNRIIDKRAWIEALVFWHENNYLAKSVGKQCDKYDEKIIERSRKNGKNQHTETERQRREREAAERISFNRDANKLLENEGIIQVGCS